MRHMHIIKHGYISDQMYKLNFCHAHIMSYVVEFRYCIHRVIKIMSHLNAIFFPLCIRNNTSRYSHIKVPKQPVTLLNYNIYRITHIMSHMHITHYKHDVNTYQISHIMLYILNHTHNVIFTKLYT